jgi:hypothetical protein
MAENTSLPTLKRLTAACALFVLVAGCMQAAPGSPPAPPAPPAVAPPPPSPKGLSPTAGSGDDDAPVRIPLTVTADRAGTYKPRMTIALGAGKTLPFAFDTGSSGLHVFADAHLEGTAGVQCSQTPTSVTYGNPGKITYSGVICQAQLHFEGYSTPATVPIGYLTSASCASTNPGCQIPDVHDYRAMHSYGIFGAALTGITNGDASVPNPILTLPGRRGSTYNITLTRDRGELLLGGQEPANAAEFRLNAGARTGQRYSFPQTCLFVNGRPIDVCLPISFDTGNGVPWFHDVDSKAIPQEDGIVKPGTRIGFAPPGDTRQATSVVAGSSFADKIKLADLPGRAPLTNVSIQAFLDRVVTYDNTRGVIAVAPPP